MRALFLAVGRLFDPDFGQVQVVLHVRDDDFVALAARPTRTSTSSTPARPELDRDADRAVAADDEGLTRGVVGERPALDPQGARLAFGDDEDVGAQARAKRGVRRLGERDGEVQHAVLDRRQDFGDRALQVQRR